MADTGAEAAAPQQQRRKQVAHGLEDQKKVRDVLLKSLQVESQEFGVFPGLTRLIPLIRYLSGLFSQISN